MGQLLLQKIKIFFGLFLLIISVAIITLTLSQINKPKTTRSKASEISPTTTFPPVSRKKGVAGAPFKGALNRAYDLNISWFYNWAYIPFWWVNYPENFSNETWNNPRLEFVPMWPQKPYLNLLGIKSCKTTSDQQKMFNAIATNMNQICNAGYCNQNPGRHHIIGNEPDLIYKDSDGVDRSTDLPGDAASCYGTIIKAIKSKDSTAKFIILGLSKENKWDNYNFLLSFFVKWKQIWAGTDLYNLTEIISGWHLHTYYGSYNSCPNDDLRPRDYINTINELTLWAFGQTVPNQELWITEMGSLFNLPSRSNPIERNKFLNQMECLVNVYENSPIVTRYAWFYAGTSPSWEATSLYNLSTSSYCVQPSSGGYCLTDLGVKYASIPTSSPNSPTSTPIPTNTPIPTTTTTPNPTASPTSNPAATPTVTLTPTPTVAFSCICKSDNTCDSSCTFDKLTGVTYTPAYKCTLNLANQWSTAPTAANKNSFCTRRLRTKGDADGNGTIDELIDFGYYFRGVIGAPIPQTVNPDFDGDGVIGNTDLEIWLTGREL